MKFPLKDPIEQGSDPLQIAMTRLRILCCKKVQESEQKIEITQVGGVNARGEKWAISTKDAIHGIQNGDYEFYIVHEFQELEVLVSEDPEKQLLARDLGYLHNLLEDLPDCP